MPLPVDDPVIELARLLARQAVAEQDEAGVDGGPSAAVQSTDTVATTVAPPMDEGSN